MRWSSKRLFGGDTAYDALQERSSGHDTARVSGPVRRRLAFSKRFYPESVPSNTPVVGLFVPVGPSAIARLVVVIVVHALDGMMRRRTRPHVRIEQLEVVPPVAYFDAASTISRIVALFRIGTAGQHCRPVSVCGHIGHAVGPVSINEVLPMQATAASRGAALQVVGVDHSLGATSAAAQPLASLISGSREAKDSPAAKGLSGEVMHEGRQWGMIVHVVNLLTRLSATLLGVPAPQEHSYALIIPQRGRFEDVIHG